MYSIFRGGGGNTQAIKLFWGKCFAKLKIIPTVSYFLKILIKKLLFYIKKNYSF